MCSVKTYKIIVDDVARGNPGLILIEWRTNLHTHLLHQIQSKY